MGLIPARGGSKGIPRKNIHPLAGKPLIAWTIETALACSSLDRTIVSTDNQEIARIARSYGGEVPFSRPSELSQDDTPDLPVCQHALAWLAEHDGYHPDIVVWLRPTCPLRRVEDIQAAVERLAHGGADCVRSVSLVEHHPYWMKRLEADRLVPLIEGKNEQIYYQRQTLPPIYRLNGAVDVTWARNVMKAGFLFGGDMRAHVMDPWPGMDLDDELDFMLAEALMERRESCSVQSA